MEVAINKSSSSHRNLEQLAELWEQICDAICFLKVFYLRAVMVSGLVKEHILSLKWNKNSSCIRIPNSCVAFSCQLIFVFMLLFLRFCNLAVPSNPAAVGGEGRPGALKWCCCVTEAPFVYIPYTSKCSSWLQTGPQVLMTWTISATPSNSLSMLLQK